MADCDHDKAQITIDGEEKCAICDDVDLETLGREIDFV